MIIAEIGSVHDGSFGNAKKLIECAAMNGANAVKFQTHISEAETTKYASSPSYFNSESRFEYFLRTGFSKDQWLDLRKTCLLNNVEFLSSPFSLEAVDLLEEIGLNIYKIPSGEVTNIPLLEKISNLGKPVFLSSGMSNWEELDRAVSVFKKKCKLTIMQCSSIYPCPPEKVGLNILSEIRERYQCDIGFSDHTEGIAAPIAAAALGASVIEKHFTFSKQMYGSDAKHSMEPNEFKEMTKAINETWRMIQFKVDKNNLKDVLEMKDIFEKSIVAKHKLTSGTILKASDLAFKKPGTGISASKMLEVIGMKLKKDMEVDELLAEEWLI